MFVSTNEEQGLPGKNIRSLLGRPLIDWPISAARQSKWIEKIVVSTDSEEIADVSRKAGAQVPFLRPSELAEDSSSTFDVIEHALETLGLNDEFYDYLILLEPTSPYRVYSDLMKGLKLFQETDCQKASA